VGGSATDASELSPLDAVLRHCGARMVTRRGRRVAAHFGSAASEAAVCLSTVGIADRSDRRTLELRGPPADLDAALADLPLAWWSRVSSVRAIVRCDLANEAGCRAVLGRSPGAAVVAPGDDYAAIGLIGPRAQELLDRLGDERQFVVVREADDCLELLVTADRAPELWQQLLAAGKPLNVACVGLDALENLAASWHLGH
jgi:glycine cleavage system aminomethyltransferase T